MVNVTTHPAIEFFQALGKKEVFIRCLPGKANPDDSADCYSGKAFNVKNGNKFSWPADSWDRLVKVLDINLKNNFCPYVTIANGGKKKDEINSSSALFAEYDAKDISKEDSLKIIREFELQPNIVIETRNGYHFYWLLEEALDVDSWQNINSRLVDKLGSDPCTRDDLARIMRIPGYPHLQKGSEPFMVELIKCDTSFKYTDDDFNRVLPVAKVNKPETDKFKEETDKFRQELLEQGIDFHDMRELAKKLPHYNEFGRKEYATCVCPAHGLDGKKGHHPESLHINRETGRFNCKNHCSNSDVYRAAYQYLGLNSSYRLVDIVLADKGTTQQYQNQHEQRNETEENKETKVELLKELLDYLEEIEHTDFKDYDWESWKDNLDLSLQIAKDGLLESLAKGNLNGHTGKGNELLEKYILITGDKPKDKSQSQEFIPVINLKREIIFSQLDQDLRSLMLEDKDPAELEIELGNISQKHYGNRNANNIQFLESRYEELFEESLDDDACSIGQQIREQAKAIPQLDYKSAFEFSPLLTEIFDYCVHHNIPLTHSFVSFLVASTALLPSNLEMVYSKLHTTIPTIFMLLVSESTAGKDLITDTFFKPLASMHHANENENEEIEQRNEELKEQHLEARKNLEGRMEKPEYEPYKRKYIIKDANIDSRKADLALNKGHRLLEQDSEYTTLIKGIKDRHSKTGSSGIEDELIRIYNGEQFSDSRVTKKGSRGTYALSIMSNTQFERVPEAIDMDNKSGLTSRLTLLAFKGYIEIEDEYMGPEDSGENSSLLLMHKIKDFYKNLEQFWSIYENSKEFSEKNYIYMSPEAFQLMKAWIIEINKKSIQTQHKGFRQWLRRVRQNATRFCMVWHCIKQALGSSDGEIGLVNSITVMETIQLMEELIPMAEELFRIGVAEAIPSSKKELIQRIIDLQSRINRPINIRDIRRLPGIRGTKNRPDPKASELHSLLKSLAEDYQLGTYDKKVGFIPF